jgi:hypothetical protein
MLSFVQIKDFPSSRTYQVIFHEDDLDEMEDWDTDDEHLLKFKDSEIFRGRTSWAMLLPLHFKILISQHCAQLTGITGAEREAYFGEESEFLLELTNLLAGYIRCLQETNGAYVDLCNIHILEHAKVNFDVNLSMSVESQFLEKPRKSGLKIIVDNTKA